MANRNKTAEEVGCMSIREAISYYKSRKNQYKGMAKAGVFEEFYKTHEKHNCTQCKGHVPYKVATLQIENKRELAPICLSCILK